MMTLAQLRSADATAGRLKAARALLKQILVSPSLAFTVSVPVLFGGDYYRSGSCVLERPHLVRALEAQIAQWEQMLTALGVDPEATS